MCGRNRAHDSLNDYACAECLDEFEEAAEKYEQALRKIWNDGRDIPGCDANWIAGEALGMHQQSKGENE